MDPALKAAQEQLHELSKQAGVLGKQAASNLRKGEYLLPIA